MKCGLLKDENTIRICTTITVKLLHFTIGLHLKGNCSEKILLQNIFGFHVYITNIYVKLSTETVIMQKNNFEQF